MTHSVFLDRNGPSYVILEQHVVRYICRYAQRRPWQAEAGGELFSPNPYSTPMHVTLATGPHRTDIRRRRYFRPDSKKMTDTRLELFETGLHAIGIWHTHPQAVPSPSQKDIRTARQYLHEFQSMRRYYLLLTAGNKGRPPRVSVCLVRSGEQGGSLSLCEAGSEEFRF